MTLAELAAHFGVSHQAVWRVVGDEREKWNWAAEHSGQVRKKRDAFQEQVRELYASGLSQQEIASRTGLSQQHVSRIVRGLRNGDQTGRRL